MHKMSRAWDPGCCFEDVLVEEEVGRGDLLVIDYGTTIIGGG